MNFLHVVRAFCLWCALSVLPVHSTALSQPLLDEQELSALVALPTVRLLDIRPANDYVAGHIPHAVSAPYGKWRGPATNPGQLIETDDLQQLVRDLGLDINQHVIVYSSGDSQTDFGAAARVYWTLKYAGFPHLSVLNGGYQQWQRAELAVDTQIPDISPSQFEIEPNQEIVIFQKELLEKVNDKNDAYQLIDARPSSFYEGKVKAPTANVPGTISGAINTQHQQWFNQESATLKSQVDVLKLVQQQGLDQASETVSFCNTGHWAATNWFVLSEVAQLPNVRLYPASLAEWTQSATLLPMSNTPSRAEQIRTKFQQLFKSE